jgi:hypothetical protein
MIDTLTASACEWHAGGAHSLFVHGMPGPGPPRTWPGAPPLPDHPGYAPSRCPLGHTGRITCPVCPIAAQSLVGQPLETANTHTFDLVVPAVLSASHNRRDGKLDMVILWPRPGTIQVFAGDGAGGLQGTSPSLSVPTESLSKGATSLVVAGVWGSAGVGSGRREGGRARAGQRQKAKRAPGPACIRGTPDGMFQGMRAHAIVVLPAVMSRAAHASPLAT